MPTVTVDDISLMTADEIRTFLTQENVQFSPGAMKPELITVAREYVAKGNAAKDAAGTSVPVVPPPPVVSDVPVDELLRLLQAKGFRDAKELREYLNAIERDIAALDVKKAEIDALYLDLEQRDIKMKEREAAVLAQAESVRADIAKQSELYEKNAKIKESLVKAGVVGTSM